MKRLVSDRQVLVSETGLGLNILVRWFCFQHLSARCSAKRCTNKISYVCYPIEEQCQTLLVNTYLCVFALT